MFEAETDAENKKGGSTNQYRFSAVVQPHFQSLVGKPPMGYWAFIKEYDLMDSIREFFTSSSGLALARRGLGLGWVISALTGVAILLGAKEAKADRPHCPIVDCSPNSTECPDSTRPIYCYDECGHGWCTT